MLVLLNTDGEEVTLTILPSIPFTEMSCGVDQSALTIRSDSSLPRAVAFDTHRYLPVAEEPAAAGVLNQSVGRPVSDPVLKKYLIPLASAPVVMVLTGLAGTVAVLVLLYSVTVAVLKPSRPSAPTFSGCDHSDGEMESVSPDEENVPATTHS